MRTARDGRRVSERFPDEVFGSGVDPNAQLSMANERTFLAWIRTSLALLAGAVAIHTPAVELEEWVKTAASLVLLGAAALAILQSWSRWRRVERAIRTGQPMPGFGGPAILAAILGSLVAAVAVGVIVVAVR